MKTCTCCKRKIPIDNFPDCKKGRGGKNSQCTKCLTEKRLVWRSKNKSKDSETHKRWKKNNPKKYKECWKTYNDKKRLQVLLIVGKGNLMCVNCGCNKQEFLEINHKNGGGAKEYKHGNTHSKFCQQILSGDRSVDDLELLCRPCNVLHYLVKNFGETKHKIIWKGIQDDKSVDL